MNSPVQYERLRPEQIRERREAWPVLYIPLGTLEWHGFHNPVGLDALKIHQLCIRCAEAGGGLVFPPLWYGEAREEGLIDSTPGFREGVAKAMGLPSGNFVEGYMRRSPAETFSAYQNLLLHILNQGQSLGFKVLVLACGHYPLIDHARAAASIYHQQRRLGDGYGKEGKAIPWAFTGYELVKDLYPDAGDHAGFWETSLLMALDSEGVDLSVLPEDKNETLLAVETHRPVQEASAEYGEEAIGRIVERVIAQVRDRLENRDAYLAHGVRF